MPHTNKPIHVQLPDGTDEFFGGYCGHVEAAAKLAAGLAAERKHNRHGAREEADRYVIWTRAVAMCERCGERPRQHVAPPWCDDCITA